MNEKGVFTLTFQLSLSRFNFYFHPHLSASSSLLPRFIFEPHDPAFEFRSQLRGKGL